MQSCERGRTSHNHAVRLDAVVLGAVEVVSVSIRLARLLDGFRNLGVHLLRKRLRFGFALLGFDEVVGFESDSTSHDIIALVHDIHDMLGLVARPATMNRAFSDEAGLLDEHQRFEQNAFSEVAELADVPTVVHVSLDALDADDADAVFGLPRVSKAGDEAERLDELVTTSEGVNIVVVVLTVANIGTDIANRDDDAVNINHLFHIGIVSALVDAVVAGGCGCGGFVFHGVCLVLGSSLLTLHRIVVHARFDRLIIPCIGDNQWHGSLGKKKRVASEGFVLQRSHQLHAELP